MNSEYVKQMLDTMVFSNNILNTSLDFNDVIACLAVAILVAFVVLLWSEEFAGGIIAALVAGLASFLVFICFGSVNESSLSNSKELLTKDGYTSLMSADNKQKDAYDKWEKSILMPHIKKLAIVKETDIISYKTQSNTKPGFSEVIYKDKDGKDHTIESSTVITEKINKPFVTYSIIDDNYTYKYKKGDITNVTLHLPIEDTK